MSKGLTWWRFKGDKEWRIGYHTQLNGGLHRIGNYNGDTTGVV